MPERIPATAWLPPQEPADCSGCREAKAALTPDGLAAAGARVALRSSADPDLPVRADHERLHQVLRNLLENGLKYTGNKRGEGAGLGLAIVRRPVLAMGGSVWGESIPGEGSSFFAELPLWTGVG
jgi:signal transduction histidine kinase